MLYLLILSTETARILEKHVLNARLIEALDSSNNLIEEAVDNYFHLK